MDPQPSSAAARTWKSIHFLRQLNQSRLRRDFPDVQTIAEESTAWPGVSRPVAWGGHSNDNPETMNGLGFGMKWNMGWMHDTLRYMQRDPLYRRYHHNEITFRSLYAFTENFVLPLSHDEVVHGKGSLLNKMPGDRWQKFANLRLLFGYMYSQPGKKLLFMGSELAQWREWNNDTSLDWHLSGEGPHRGIERLIRDLNLLYRDEPAMHVRETEPEGFVWVDGGDTEQSVLTYLRVGTEIDRPILVVLNFTPVVRHEYRVGVPTAGAWDEVLNTDAETYNGSGVGNLGQVMATETPQHGRPCSVSLSLPPLAAVFFRGPEPWAPDSSGGQ